jgi:signal transduction histidine kinase
MNLAVNARDAMPKGGKVTIETANVELDERYARRHDAVQPGEYALLAISDTGSGMDGETKNRLFEPFFTTKDRGTGLGLAISRALARGHGGDLEVPAAGGGGAVFVLRLPLAAGPRSVP